LALIAKRQGKRPSLKRQGSKQASIQEKKGMEGLAI
jgi:hypothetical protein